MKEQAIIPANVLDPERQNESGGCITAATRCRARLMSIGRIAVITIISLITVIKFYVGVTLQLAVNKGGEATNKDMVAGAIN